MCNVGFLSQIIMKTAIQELIEASETFNGHDLFKWIAKNKTFLLEKEKQELSRALEQGRQGQWESSNMKKGLQPHNISFDEYYSERYCQAVT
jgi:hypothetical protein